MDKTQTISSQPERRCQRPIKHPSLAKPTEMLNERQVADYLNMSIGSLRKWRLFRTGPSFVKIGRAIRY
jgi:hypothetical protein